MFEFDQFGGGTKTVSMAIANAPGFSLAGGGDTIAAIQKYDIYDKVSYISTAGGAFLEFLEGKTLPAVAMLEERPRSRAKTDRRLISTVAQNQDCRHARAGDRRPQGAGRNDPGRRGRGPRQLFPRRLPRNTSSAPRTVRNRARAHGRQVGVLADLQGPKIRIERFERGQVHLQEGDRFILDAELDAKAGDHAARRHHLQGAAQRREPRRHPAARRRRLVLWVEEVNGGKVECRVKVGGVLSNNKGINRQGGGLSAAALTDKDRADIRCAAEMQADYVAVSFPRCAGDIHEARELLRAAGGQGGIVAKIERAEAMDVLDDIIRASDAVMIARGDLGVEIGDAELPAVQKKHHPGRARDGSCRDHRDPDDAVDDREPDPDPRRGV